MNLLLFGVKKILITMINYYNVKARMDKIRREMKELSNDFKKDLK